MCTKEAKLKCHHGTSAKHLAAQACADQIHVGVCAHGEAWILNHFFHNASTTISKLISNRYQKWRAWQWFEQASDHTFFAGASPPMCNGQVLTRAVMYYLFFSSLIWKLLQVSSMWSICFYFLKKSEVKTMISVESGVQPSDRQNHLFLCY